MMYFPWEETIITFIILFVIAVIMWIILANELYKAACAKGFKDRKYFWIPFLFGAFGALVIIALPDRGLVRKAVPKKDELPDL